MALKLHKHTELSTKTCKKCGKPLKKNLLNKLPNAELCFKCWYPIETARKGGHGQGRIERGFRNS